MLVNIEAVKYHGCINQCIGLCMTFEYPDTPNRLKALGLERLELRRLHMDLITCYNVIHGHISIPFDSFFEFSAH